MVTEEPPLRAASCLYCVGNRRCRDKRLGARRRTLQDDERSHRTDGTERAALADPGLDGIWRGKSVSEFNVDCVPQLTGLPDTSEPLKTCAENMRRP